MSGLKVIFMGTPDFSVPALEAIIESDHEVVAVYTQPPRPKGRGKKVQPSPVDHTASTHGIPVFIPKSLKKDADARAQLQALNADIAVVAAYGLMLPQDVLDAPKHGCLNIHASILPRWRGASPIQHAIWHGDAESGVSIMQMTEGLDAGPYCDIRKVPITQTTTAQQLHDELGQAGATAIIDVLDRYAAGDIPEMTEQDEAQMTYAPMLKKEDGVIDWSKTASEIDCQIRGLNPWPGTFTYNADSKRLKIIEARVVDMDSTGHAVGSLIDRDGHVACGQNTCLKLISIQPENAKRMDVSSAMNGHYLKPDHEVFSAPSSRLDS